MNVRVTIDLSIPAQKKHLKQMRQAASILTDTESSVEVIQAPDNPRRLVATFTVPTAPQGDVVDQIGREFWRWIENYNDSSIGFSRSARKSR